VAHQHANPPVGAISVVIVEGIAHAALSFEPPVKQVDLERAVVHPHAQLPVLRAAESDRRIHDAHDTADRGHRRVAPATQLTLGPLPRPYTP